LTLEREGVRLAATDFGGTGPSVLLLHGLGGHTGEWTDTAAWMTATHRVAALDARGHGESERHPEDVSLEARVADVVFAVEQHHLAPVTLIGQSLGAITALLVAAEHPELVSALVLVDADPAEGDEAIVGDTIAVLASWPDPQFDLDVMERTLRETLGRSFWPEWDRLACPTLVLLGENGIVAPKDADAMSKRARVIEIPGAGHDLHLDSPAGWRTALTDFLAQPPV
jgi:pimeloyl-ACP methyl ester carboxylesterase